VRLPAGILVASLCLSLPAAAAAAVPVPPRDVYAEVPRPDQVTLSWQPGIVSTSDDAPADRFQVLRDGELVAETRGTSLMDDWLAEGRRYTYVVRAVDAAGQTADSPPLSVATPPFTAGLELAPYLQQLEPRRAAIVWQTYVPASTSLHFGPEGGPLRVVKRATTLSRDHVVVVKDLRPATRYTYQWESDGRLGPAAGFQTPPLSPARFSFGVIGDFGVPTPAAAANLRRLSEDDVDLAITTGDNAQIYGNEEEYRNYVLGPLHGFLASRPFWPGIGNHDYYGLGNYRRYFALPGNERYYSFSYGGVMFLALDSNRITATQRSWARRKLRSSRASCKVAYFHHPVWSSGRGYRSHVRKRRREAFVPLLQRGGVDLVLNGHVQNYDRSKPQRRGRRSRRGVVYIVSGGGGARLNGFATRRRPRWSARRGAFYHRLRITAANHVLRGKAIDTAGRTRDRFTVRCR
jgi:3',5'-cyclic AMP phosphodiesterase CpdA